VRRQCNVIFAVLGTGTGAVEFPGNGKGNAAIPVLDNCYVAVRGHDTCTDAFRGQVNVAVAVLRHGISTGAISGHAKVVVAVLVTVTGTGTVRGHGSGSDVIAGHTSVLYLPVTLRSLGTVLVPLRSLGTVPQPLRSLGTLPVAVFSLVTGNSKVTEHSTVELRSLGTVPVLL